MMDRLTSWRSFVVSVLSLLLVTPTIDAQLRPLLPGEEFDQAAELYHLRRLPRDPLVYTSYINGLQAIEGGDVPAGLETLQSVLDGSTDFFFHQNMKLNGSLLSRVDAAIAKHREDYERLYGVEAQQLLDDAMNSQQQSALERVVQRFAQTEAGAKATEHLARRAVDLGDVGLAARLYERLIAHGATPDKSAMLAKTLRLSLSLGQQRHARVLIEKHAELIEKSELAHREFVRESPEKFLQQFVASTPVAGEEVFEWRSVFGGENHRARSAFAPAIFDAEWEVPTIDEWDFSQLPVELKQQLQEQSQQTAEAIEDRIRSKNKRVTLPAATPLIVGDLVLVRGAGTIKAFQRQSGELAWVTEALIEPTFNYLNQASYSPNTARDPMREEMRELFFSQRGWRDLTSAALSTDGTNVYAISDCQLVGTVKQNLLIQNTTEHPLLPQRRNRLTAYSIAAEGKVVWSIGQSSLSFGNLEERDIFFHGAPLAVDDHLYVLGEERGQIQLFEIDPASGTVLWSLGLLNPEKDLLLSDARRMAGLTPSYAAGLLICPTGEGVITAIDPVRRAVVWSHQYLNEMQSFRNRLAMMRGVRPQHQSVDETIHEQLADDRWFDSRMLVAEDYVLFAPPDDNNLVCLDVLTGDAVWTLDNAGDQSLYLAGATSEALLLVSRTEVSALRLADGASFWQEPIPLDLPSGRGLRMGDQYLLPLITGELAVIDVVAGQLLTRIPSRSGKVTGNLAAAHGTLVTQTGTSLRAFRSADSVSETLQELAQQKDGDPEVLAIQGELKLQRGEVDDALADLRRAAQSNMDQRTRQVLAWALLSGLKHDFSKYAMMAEEIESYLTSTAQRLAFRKTYAQGLQRAGDHEKALTYYLTLLKDLPAVSAVNDLSSRWAVSDERWVLARIEELFAEVESTAPFQRRLTEWVVSLESVAQRMRLLKAFSLSQLDASIVLKSLADLPASEDTALDHQAVLLKLKDSNMPAIRQQATKRLTLWALQQGDGSAAERYLELLTRTDRNLAKEFENEVRADEQWSDAFFRVPNWPQHVEVETDPRRVSSLRRFPLPVIGQASVALQGWSFALDEMGSRVEVFDADGRRRARIPTGLIQSRTVSMGAAVGRYVELRGHLALVVLADRFLLLDLISNPDQPQLIFKQNLITEQDNPYSSRSAIFPQQRAVVGMRTFISRTPTNSLAGNVGPLNLNIVCFGFGTDLIAIDPTTGQELWRRRDLEQGSEIFGDNEFVIVKPYEEERLLVYRATDGAFVTERTLPQSVLPTCIARQLGDWGRCLPIRTIEKQMHWKLYDPVTDSLRWEVEYDIDTQWAPVNGHDIAFLETDNTLTIRNGLTGVVQAELELPLEFLPGSFSIMSYVDQWLCVISERTQFQMPTGEFSSASQVLSAPIDGICIAIDRESAQVQWQHRLDNLSFVTSANKRWPIVFFANNHGQDAELLIIQRHTGEVLMEDAWSNDKPDLAWDVETQPMSIKLRFATRSIQLKCTDPLDTQPAKPENTPQ